MIGFRYEKQNFLRDIFFAGFDNNIDTGTLINKIIIKLKKICLFL